MGHICFAYRNSCGQSFVLLLFVRRRRWRLPGFAFLEDSKRRLGPLLPLFLTNGFGHVWELVDQGVFRSCLFPIRDTQEVLCQVGFTRATVHVSPFGRMAVHMTVVHGASLCPLAFKEASFRMVLLILTYNAPTKQVEHRAWGRTLMTSKHWHNVLYQLNFIVCLCHINPSIHTNRINSLRPGDVYMRR